ncbi:MAG: hypothetical protein IPN74_18040 [Haliscomenobacter sp.]|jgi:hypothetical protein|nr:hypothetical protein [Haliscomenobacter sp.]
MKLQKYKAPFYISSITWKEVTGKVALDHSPLMEDVLNAHLNLSDYGSGLVSLAVTFLAVQPGNALHKEEMTYRLRKKEAYIQTKLPYERVAQDEKSQTLHLMASIYLDAVKDMSKLNIPDFNLSQFAEDLELLFEEQGWLVVSC